MSRFLPLLAFVCAGCAITPDSTCDSVALGHRAPSSARPASWASWCGQHPGRNSAGLASQLRCCHATPDAGCGGLDCGAVTAQLMAYGDLIEQHSDTAQCCLFVDDGGVVGKDVGFD